MSREVFNDVELSNGKKARIFEGYGVNFFNALTNAGENSSLMIKFLIIELVEINGKKTTEKDIDELPIKDISYLSEVIGVMISNEYRTGL